MRKKKAEEPENSERWMLTYLDMITLLMAFFCILFAMANVNATKFKQVAQSMSMALGTGGGGGSSMLTNFSGTGISPQTATSANSLIQLRENNEFKAIMRLIREYSAKEGLSKSVKASITERGLVVNLADSVLFSSGSAELSAKARGVLDRLAELLFKTGSVIRVEGYTDNVPIHTARYQSNLQLSTDRATNVIMYWLSKYPEQSPNLSAAGYGEYHSIAPNETNEGRAANRRVEIVVLRRSNPNK